MSISLTSDQTGPFIADIDGGKTNFIIDPNRAGLALPRNMAESKPQLPVEEKTQSAVNTALKPSESAEVSKNIRNYGKPPEDFGIAIVTKIRKFSDTEPECAESTETPGVWFYNRPAIKQLMDKWVQIPWEEVLLAHINAIPGNTTAKAQVMNGKDEPFPGFRSAGYGEVCFRGNGAYWWVASPDGSARYIYLNRGNQNADSYSSNPRDGFLVPFLSDKN